MTSGRSPWMPIAPSTTWMPTSWSAMYGIVARMPVTATASASAPLSKRPRTKSAAVMYPCLCDTLHRRGITTKTNGYVMTVYGSAKKPSAPAP